jgi:uncharacterized protein (DUF302 family)
MKTIKKPFLFIFLTLFSYSSVFLATGSETGELKKTEYYFSTTMSGNLEEVTAKVKAALKKHGFGVITETDMHKKLNAALNKNLKPYRLLGVCDPSIAYEAMQVEKNIGLMLPCKIVIREMNKGAYEVSSVEPKILMDATGNQGLDNIGNDVSERLQNVIKELK